MTDYTAEDARLHEHLLTLDDDDLFELFLEQTDSVARFAAMVKTAISGGYTDDGVLPLKAQASSVRQLGIIAEAFVNRVMTQQLKI